MTTDGKLEGDDRTTLEMYNAFLSPRGGTVITPEEWRSARYSGTRCGMSSELAWVREHLVAPAVAEAERRIVGLQNALSGAVGSRREEERKNDSLRAKVAALEARFEARGVKVSELQAERIERRWQEDSLRELLVEMREAGQARWANRIERFLPGKSNSNEPCPNCHRILAVGAPAALPKVGETVEVCYLGNWRIADVVEYIPGGSFRAVERKTRASWTLHVDHEGDTWRRVQPQPSEPAPEAAPAEPRSYPKGETPGWVLQEEAVREACPCPFPLPSEPPPEDVATPLIDGLVRFAYDVPHGMRPRRGGPYVRFLDAQDAIIDGIARATEKLRAELAELAHHLDACTPEGGDPCAIGCKPKPFAEVLTTVKKLRARLLTAERIANEANRLAADSLAESQKLRAENARLKDEAADWALRASTPGEEPARLRRENEKLRKDLETSKRLVSRVHDSWQVAEAARANLETECDDLRRQLREHAVAVECEACGTPLNGDDTYSVRGLRKEFLCESCAEKDSDVLRAAIDARRAGR